MIKKPTLYLFLMIALFFPFGSKALEGDLLIDYPSNPTASDDRAYDMAVDSSGIYIAGFSASGGGSDMYLEKVSHTGVKLWSKYLGANIFGSAYANAIAVDTSGVYVAGFDVSSAGSYEWRIEKRSLVDGSPLWVAPITEDLSVGWDMPNAIAVDASGVYIAGGVQRDSVSGYWRVEKRDLNTGALIGSPKNINVSNGFVTRNEITGMAVDSTGVYVTGSFSNSAGGISWQTEKLSLDLSIGVWAAISSNPVFTYLNNIPNGIAVDTTSVYVVGGNEWIVGKINKSSGADSGPGTWYKKETSIVSGYGFPYSIAADGFGNVLLAGYTLPSTGGGAFWRMEKRDSSGNIVVAFWPKIADFGPNHDVPRSIKVVATAPNNGAYIAGYDTAVSASDVQLRLQKREFLGSCTAPGAFTWTDPTITAGTTAVKAVHINDLRNNINTARGGAGLLAATWTDPTITAGVTLIKAIHIQELRTAISEVYTACGGSAPIFTDVITTGTPIKKIHIDELRSAVNLAP